MQYISTTLYNKLNGTRDVFFVTMIKYNQINQIHLLKSHVQDVVYGTWDSLHNLYSYTT